MSNKFKKEIEFTAYIRVAHYFHVNPATKKPEGKCVNGDCQVYAHDDPISRHCNYGKYMFRTDGTFVEKPNLSASDPGEAAAMEAARIAFWAKKESGQRRDRETDDAPKKDEEQKENP